MEHHREPHERRIVGDIIAHILIGAWMIAVGISVAIQACNAKSISSLRSSRKTALFASVSGTLFWAFIAAYQIIIAMFRGVMKPTWLDHIEIASVLALSFLVQYLYTTGTLTESFWILAEPVGVCTMAVTLGFMHSQHAMSDEAYHRIIGVSLVVLSLMRLLAHWGAWAATEHKSENSACASSSDASSVPLSANARSSPFVSIASYLYVLNGVYMADIALTPYMRPQLVAGLDRDALYHFAFQRFIRFTVLIFFLFAAARLLITYCERNQRRRGDSTESSV